MHKATFEVITCVLYGREESHTIRSTGFLRTVLLYICRLHATFSFKNVAWRGRYAELSHSTLNSFHINCYRTMKELVSNKTSDEASFGITSFMSLSDWCPFDYVILTQPWVDWSKVRPCKWHAVNIVQLRGLAESWLYVRHTISRREFMTQFFSWIKTTLPCCWSIPCQLMHNLFPITFQDVSIGSICITDCQKSPQYISSLLTRPM